MSTLLFNHNTWPITKAETLFRAKTSTRNAITTWLLRKHVHKPCKTILGPIVKKVRDIKVLNVMCHEEVEIEGR